MEKPKPLTPEREEELYQTLLQVGTQLRDAGMRLMKGCASRNGVDVMVAVLMSTFPGQAISIIPNEDIVALAAHSGKDQDGSGGE